MPDNIDHYVPEFDEEEMRERLSAHPKEILLEMLLRSYKQTRLAAKMADESEGKLRRIGEVLEEPSALLTMPRIPGADDIKRMTEE